MGNSRSVFKRDGKWVNKRDDSSKASSLHSTQKNALSSARKMLKNQGGGELTIMRAKGLIRDKDTVAPGNDPYPPKG